MRRVLSWKRLLIVVGAVIVLGGTTYAVHEVQVRRLATSVKERAQKAEEAAADDPAKAEEAIKLYGDYIKYRPKDEDAFTRYTSLVFGQAKADPKNIPTAIDIGEKFLRQFPDHPEERRKLIDLYLKVGPLNSARQHILILFNAPGKNFRRDADLLEKIAVCELAAGEIPMAITYLDQAIATGEAPAKVFDQLLGTLHGNPSFKDAQYTPSKYLEIMLGQEPYRSSIEVRVVAGRFLLLRGDAPGAREQIAFARTQMPGGTTHPDVLIASAELEMAEIKTAEAIPVQLKKAQTYMDTAFQVAPRNVRVGLFLAEILSRQGEIRRAVDVLKTTADALGETNDEFLFLVDRLIDLGEQELSAKLIERISANEADRVRIGKYLSGRLALLKGDYTLARTLLEEVTPTLSRVPEFHKKAACGLGRCYEIAQNPDRQLDYYRAALKDDALYLPAVLGEADALLRLGKFREALSRYTTIVKGYKLEQYRPTLARLELRAVLTQPPGNQNWAAFEASLGPAENRPTELQILYAESLAARNEPAKAAAILEAVVQANPGAVSAWVGLARIRGGKPDAIIAILDEAEKKGGADTVDLRLARAVVTVNRGRKPNPAELRKLATGGEKFDKLEQRLLWIGLGEAALRAAQNVPNAETREFHDLVIEFYGRAAALDKLDLIPRVVLIDLGAMTGRRDVTDRALAEIADVEGANGPISTLARVILRLPVVRKIEDTAARAGAIRELRVMAEQAKKDRPGWPRVYVVLAQLDELEGHTADALTNYLEAIAKGERQEYVFRRAVELYRAPDRRQDDQAAALLNQYHTEVLLSDDLERFRVVHNLVKSDIPRSERDTIDRIARADSKDYRLLLLRGALLAAIGAEDDALAAFRSAVAWGEAMPETWKSLVGFLVRHGKIDEARAAVAEAVRKLQLNPPKTDAAHAEMLIALANCHEIIEAPKEAEEYYRRAVKLAGKELNPNRELVLYLQRTGRAPEVEQILRRLIDDPAQDLARWARRYRALGLITGQEGYSRRAAALELIDRNLTAATKDPEDVKARATIQTVDPVTREEGIRTLKEFAKWGDLTPDEFYLLGQLHFHQGGDKVFESVEFFEQAARSRPGVSPEHMAALVRIYAAINKPDHAARALERLRTFAPRSWEAAREEARLKHRAATAANKDGKPEEAKRLDAQARDLVLKFPGALTEKAIGQRTGPLLEELGFLTDAEAVYTQLLKEGTDAGPHVPLVLLLIKQKRTGAAVELALKYQDKAPIGWTAGLLTGAVRARSPGPDAERAVEQWLEGKLREFDGKPEFGGLLATRGVLLDAQRKYPEAIAAYTEALKHGRSDVAVNNLCMLLALHRADRVNDAIAMMNDLIAIRGPAPAYLDTRAVCYLVKGGMTAEAIKDLDLALLQEYRAVYLFHLAWAHDLIPEKRPTRDAELDAAKKLGLTLDDLHPLEDRKFRELYSK